MLALSEATTKYLTPPNEPRFKADRVHLEVTRSADKTLSHFITTFYNKNSYSPSGKSMPCRAMLRFAQGFPEYKHIVKEYETFKLELPITDMVVERLDHCIAKDHLTFECLETELLYRNVIIRGFRADRNAKTYAEYKESQKIPEHDLDLHEVYPLACYQQVALYNTAKTPGYALFMEQGTGKTPVGIAKICNESKEIKGRMQRSIIVCPKNVRSNWAAEFEKFATAKCKISILHGTEMDRVKQLLRAFINDDNYDATIVICSYETLSRSWNAISYCLEKLQGGGKWDTAILDESHFIKNDRTKRYKAAVKLRDISTSRVVLTGTPVTNTALDLFTQLEFLGQGYSGFYDFKNFRKFFAKFHMDQATGREIMTGMQNLPFMKERLARYSFIVKAEEVQKDLPDRVYDIVEVQMSTEQKKMYEQLRDQLALEVEVDMASTTLSKQMVVNNVLTKLMKLAQITSGFIVWPPTVDEDGNELTPRTIDDLTPDNKLAALQELLKAKGPNDKTIIWSCWVQNIRVLQEVLGEQAVNYYGGTSDADREIAVHRFNHDSACKIFIGNPAAGGTGLNLLGYPPERGDEFTTNCNHVIYYSQNWSPTARSQSEKRAHRRGAREPVRITDLVVPGSVDAEIRKAVHDKQQNALEMTDLKKILDSVLSGELISD